MSDCTVLDDDWFRENGFRYEDIPVLNGKADRHWLLWLGWAIVDADQTEPTNGPEDFGIELSHWRDDAWFCWFRADYAGRYTRFLHWRKVCYAFQVEDIIASLVGRPFDRKHVWYGSLRTPEIAARCKEEAKRLDQRMAEREARDKDQQPSTAKVRIVR